MDFAELEDQLAEETDELLSNENIVVHRGRVQGAINPNTQIRPQDASPTETPVPAINAPRAVDRDGSGKRVVTTSWEVLASRLGFTPSPEGLVVAGDGTRWKISRVESVLNNRKHKLYCVRTK